MAFSASLTKKKSIHEAEMTESGMIYNLCKGGYCPHGVHIQRIVTSMFESSHWIDTGKKCNKCEIEIKRAEIDLEMYRSEMSNDLENKKNAVNKKMKLAEEEVAKMKADNELLRKNLEKANDDAAAAAEEYACLAYGCDADAFDSGDADAFDSGAADAFDSGDARDAAFAPPSQSPDNVVAVYAAAAADAAAAGADCLQELLEMEEINEYRELRREIMEENAPHQWEQIILTITNQMDSIKLQQRQQRKQIIQYEMEIKQRYSIYSYLGLSKPSPPQRKPNMQESQQMWEQQRQLDKKADLIQKVKAEELWQQGRIDEASELGHHEAWIKSVEIEGAFFQDSLDRRQELVRWWRPIWLIREECDGIMY